MLFKSYEGKRVYFQGREIVFSDGTYETSDEKEIAALKAAFDVEEAKPEKPKKDEKPE